MEFHRGMTFQNPIFILDQNFQFNQAFRIFQMYCSVCKLPFSKCFCKFRIYNIDIMTIFLNDIRLYVAFKIIDNSESTITNISFSMHLSFKYFFIQTPRDSWLTYRECLQQLVLQLDLLFFASFCALCSNCLPEDSGPEVEATETQTSHRQSFQKVLYKNFNDKLQ